MRRTKRWCVVFSVSLACTAAASAAAPGPALGEQRGSAPAAFTTGGTSDVVTAMAANPSISLVNDRLRSAGGGVTNKSDSQLQTTAATAADDETGASLSLMLASWGLVALIALRRMFG